MPNELLREVALVYHIKQKPSQKALGGVGDPNGASGGCTMMMMMMMMMSGAWLCCYIMEVVKPAIIKKAFREKILHQDDFKILSAILTCIASYLENSDGENILYLNV